MMTDVWHYLIVIISIIWHQKLFIAELYLTSKALLIFSSPFSKTKTKSYLANKSIRTQSTISQPCSNFSPICFYVVTSITTTLFTFNRKSIFIFVFLFFSVKSPAHALAYNKAAQF